ncbi:hypothetical protein AMECASPLE_035949 [Ameca splendens]|uniref:Uncharacterized protein n=1 Tax=Ameca splendens TaxID=208324 RepID=A0ABV0XKK1_9TELE
MFSNRPLRPSQVYIHTGHIKLLGGGTLKAISCMRFYLCVLDQNGAELHANFVLVCHIKSVFIAFQFLRFLIVTFWVYIAQVVGMVTRKDLARYHLGKHGLEELHLAQT